ncbi:NAD+ synthase, partial [Candidatus Bathyarchaeota archaeon]
MNQKMTLARDRRAVERMLEVDPHATLTEIIGFVSNIFVNSRAKGIVVGLSGGIDSAVTASICVKAIGPEKVMGLLLFEKKTMEGTDSRDAKELARKLKIETLEFPIDEVFDSFLANFPIETKDRVTIGNLKARIRMASLYFIANAKNLLVAGTGDRSEDLIGYFTKYGDGGADFLPIAHLYKTQARGLGAHLGLPSQILNKPSSPNLWEGHKATDEIPLDYNVLDLALVSLFDLKMQPKDAAVVLGIDMEKLEEIIRLYNVSAHKR